VAWISVTWHIFADDDKLCPVCRSLEGYTWSFEVSKGELTDSLIHPQYGVVWNLQEGSQAHGHRGNCRCHLTYEINITDLLARVLELRKTLLEMVPEPMGAK